MNYRYYLTQRPPSLGCQPNGAVNIVTYNEITYIVAIRYGAYGYAEYDRKLTDQEISEYELIEG